MEAPQQIDGKTIFRRQFWMKLPAAAFSGDSLSLSAAGALEVRFSPRTFMVAPGNDDWISSLDYTDPVLRLGLAYPAPVVQVDTWADWAIGLFRLDGDAMSDQATLSGFTNEPLPEPFVGPALAVKFLEPVLGRRGNAIEMREKATKSRAAASQAQGAAAKIEHPKPDVILATEDTGPFDGLRIEGKPAGPRLKLVLPAQGQRSEELLWQELLPGEQTSQVSLPTEPSLAKAWQSGLERLVGLLANQPATEQVLRIDVESDAPCGIELAQASFKFEGEIELVDAPVTLRFDGVSRQTQTLGLEKAASIAAQPLRIELNLSMTGQPGAAAPDDPLPAGRVGCLLDAATRMTMAWQLDGPGYLGGVGLPWHPLSASLSGRLRLFHDAGGMPGAQPLVESDFQLDTATASWLALRWPALPLQSGRYWLQFSIKDGAGLWLADGQGPAPDGGTESARAAGEPRQQLALALALRALLDGSEAEGGLDLSLNGAPLFLCSTGDAAALDLDGSIPLPWVLSATSGRRLTATVKSARLAYAL